MSKKPELKIDTQFYGEQQNSQDRQFENILDSPSLPLQKTTSAAMFERLLSSNLAEKFISCWKTLKSLLLGKKRQYQIAYSNQNLEQKSGDNLQLDHRGHHNKSKQKILHSSASRNYYQNSRQIKRDQQNVIYRNRSVDLKLELSRAQILNKIAERLKQNRISTPKSLDNKDKIVKRLNKLERITKQIKLTNQANYNKTVTVGSRIQYEAREKDQIQTLKMLQQINNLKHQIRNMKQQNQQIIKCETQRLKQSSFKEVLHHKIQNINYSLRNPLEIPTYNIGSRPTSFHEDLKPKEIINIPQNVVRQNHYYTTNNNYIQSPPIQSNTRRTNYLPNFIQFQYKQQYLPSFSSNLLPAPSLQTNHIKYQLYQNPNQTNIKTNHFGHNYNFSNNSYNRPFNTAIPHIQIKPNIGIIPINNIGIRRGVICTICGRSCECQGIYNKH